VSDDEATKAVNDGTAPSSRNFARTMCVGGQFEVRQYCCCTQGAKSGQQRINPMMYSITRQALHLRFVRRTPTHPTGITTHRESDVTVEAGTETYERPRAGLAGRA